MIAVVVYLTGMTTPRIPEATVDDVRQRARQLRLRVQPPRRCDRFALGVLAAFLVDLVGVLILSQVHDMSGLVLLLLGPLTLATVVEVWIATALLLTGALVMRRWRLVWGVFATQAGVGLVAWLWPLVMTGGRYLPL